MTSLPPLYVSYYTIDTGYELEAAGLLSTLEAFKLQHHVAGVTPRSAGRTWSWDRATQYKAEFIRDMQDRHPGEPIVWLDADARVVQRPRLFEWLNCDLAAHWYRNKELLSGTLYFAPGADSRAVVEAWIGRNRLRPHGRCADQRNLQQVIGECRGLRIVNLPPEYAWIDAGTGGDLSARAYGRRYPVIVHRQASRRLKKHLQTSPAETVEEPVV